MFKRFLVLIPILFTIAAAHAIGTVPAVNSLILTEDEEKDKFICAEANGLLWCRYADNFRETNGAASCNEICALLDLLPVDDDVVWLDAQDSRLECEAIRDAVGVTGIVGIQPYNTACAAYNDNNPANFWCSTLAACPANHRISGDQIPGVASVCPCE